MPMPAFLKLILLMAGAAVAAVFAVFVFLAAYWPDSDGVLFGLLGDGVGYKDAYAANGQEVDRRKYVSPEQERLRMALAEVDSPKPRSAQIGERRHTPPILAHLKYETLDADGKPLESWQVRALVPPANHEPSSKAVIQCKKACRNALARRDSTQIVRSGELGVATEWLLRMPLNTPMRLQPPPTDVQDILDEKPYNIPLVSPKDGDGRVWRQPAIQVTLLSACKAQVSIASRKAFELADYTPIPIITGMRNMEWTELRGCGQLKPLAGQRGPGQREPSTMASPLPEPRSNPSDAAKIEFPALAAIEAPSERPELVKPPPIPFERLITLAKVPQVLGKVEIPQRRGRSDLPGHKPGCVPGFDDLTLTEALALAQPIEANNTTVRERAFQPWCTVHYAAREGRIRLDLFDGQRALLTMPDGSQGLVSILIGFRGRPLN
jgi:hypothetical protein